VDIGSALTSASLFDVLVFIFLFGMFVLGYIQGTIRRLLGLAAIIFSFLLAGQLRDPLGSFLAKNWTQYPPEYSYMLAYLFLFAFTAILFSIIIQSFYHPQPLFENARFVDEVIGGTLGVVEGLVLIGCGIIILDSYFTLGLNDAKTYVPFLPAIFALYDPSATASLFRTTLIPGMLAVMGALLPDSVRQMYPGGGG
jgi:uncharacterized membrane protein required for colicin V production